MEMNKYNTGKYKAVTEKLNNQLQKLNLDQPENSIISEEQSNITDLLSLSAQATQNVLEDVTFFISKIPVKTKGLDVENPQQENSEDDMKKYLKTSLEKFVLSQRQIQVVAKENAEKQSGNYIDVTAATINDIPTFVGCDETKIPDSSLKAIQVFHGDDSDDENAEKLETFIQQLSDLASTSNICEKICKATLIRKLQGTARDVVTFHIKQNEGKELSFKDLVLLLEHRFAHSYQPNISRAKLQMLTKTEEMSFTQLEAKIQKLTHLAARNEPPERKSGFIYATLNDSFKKAISAHDRTLILAENAQRATALLAPLDIAGMTNFLNNYYSKRNAYKTCDSLLLTNKSEVSQSTANTVNNIKEDTLKNPEATEVVQFIERGKFYGRQ